MRLGGRVPIGAVDVVVARNDVVNVRSAKVDAWTGSRIVGGLSSRVVLRDEVSASAGVATDGGEGEAEGGGGDGDTDTSSLMAAMMWATFWSSQSSYVGS